MTKRNIGERWVNQRVGEYILVKAINSFEWITDSNGIFKREITTISFPVPKKVMNRGTARICYGPYKDTGKQVYELLDKRGILVMNFDEIAMGLDKDRRYFVLFGNIIKRG